MVAFSRPAERFRGRDSAGPSAIQNGRRLRGGRAIVVTDCLERNYGDNF